MYTLGEKSKGKKEPVGKWVKRKEISGIRQSSYNSRKKKKRKGGREKGR